MSYSWLSNMFPTNRRIARRRRTSDRAAGRRRLEVEPLELRRLLTVYNPAIDDIDVGNNDPNGPFEGQLVDLEAIFSDADLLDTYTATIDWGDGNVENAVVSTDPRGVSPLTITIDYQFDENNFFDTQAKKDLLQMAADSVVGRFSDTLSAISPGAGNTWTAKPIHPATGDEIGIDDLEIAENEILVFVGSRELPGSTLGIGGFGGIDVSSTSGDQAFVDAVRSRGQEGVTAVVPNDVGPWGGAITFSESANINWYFDSSAEGLGPGETDFVSVAAHEFAHLLGFGTAPSWDALVDETGEVFQGLTAPFEYDELGFVPLEKLEVTEPEVKIVFPHWKEGITDGGVETAMDPTLLTGTRKLLTPLDFAGLKDIGWEVLGETGGTIDGSHVYANDGTYTVTVHLTEDDGGGSIEKTFEVSVNNVAPTLTLVGDQIIHVGDELTIVDLATITDPGFENPLASPPTEESFTFTIDWGDGTLDQGIATLDAPGGPGVLTAASLDGSHTYSEPDEYIVEVTVVDNSVDFGLAKKTFIVNVIPLADAIVDTPTPPTDANTVLRLDAPGILENDVGFDLTVTKFIVRVDDVFDDANAIPPDTPFELPSGAVVSWRSDGSVVYDPRTSEMLNALPDNTSALDVFGYTISDGRGSSDVGVLQVRVLGVFDGAVVADLNTSLVQSPTPTDSLGQVEALPADEPWIHEWETFWLEVWVQVRDREVTNIETALADVQYNTDYFTPTAVVPGPAFSGGLTSTIDDAAGTVHVEGDRTVVAQIGAARYVQLARVRFEATGADPGVPVLLNEPAPVAPVDDEWITLSAVDATVTLGTILTGVENSSAPTTELYPLLYDLDDDGRISFSDLAQFASVFLSDVNVVPQAAKSDFDASGRVNFTDFAFLAVNFLKNRDTSSTIVFPNNFPDDFGAQMLVVDGAGGPQRVTAPLTDDQAAAIAAEAAARLGASADAVTVEVVDLPGDLLGRASAGTIQLDIDAAGYGWFVDTTPSDDVEFSTEIGMTELTATDDSEAARRVDLLTVVMHELGHVLGHNHTTSHSLMDGSLPLGTRRLAGDDGDSNGDADDHSLSGTLVDDFFATLDN